MEKIKRWKLEYYEDAPHDTEMVEDINGGYVDFSDYEAQMRELLEKISKEATSQLILIDDDENEATVVYLSDIKQIFAELGIEEKK